MNGQNFLQVDSAPFILWFNLFPQTKFQKPIYHCFPDNNGNFMLSGKEDTKIEKGDCVEHRPPEFSVNPTYRPQRWNN